MNESSIQIYRLDNGATEIEVKLDQDTIWLSQKQIAELFDKDSDTIVENPTEIDPIKPK